MPASTEANHQHATCNTLLLPLWLPQESLPWLMDRSYFVASEIKSRCFRCVLWRLQNTHHRYQAICLWPILGDTASELGSLLTLLPARYATGREKHSRCRPIGLATLDSTGIRDLPAPKTLRYVLRLAKRSVILLQPGLDAVSPDMQILIEPSNPATAIVQRDSVGPSKHRARRRGTMTTTGPSSCTHTARNNLGWAPCQRCIVLLLIENKSWSCVPRQSVPSSRGK